MEKLDELRYELVPHPPYPPDLVPCDNHLFPNLKKSLDSKRFSSNNEVKLETEAYLGDFNADYFLGKHQLLKHRWIELKEDHVEK